MVKNDIINFDLPNVRNVLELYKVRFEELLKRNLMDKGNVASGDLLASIHTRLEIKDSVYEVWLDSLKYLKFIESGTKPHWPPLGDLKVGKENNSPIIKWIRHKKLPTRELTGDRTLPTEKQLSFLIGRAMAGKSPNQANTKNPKGGTYRYNTYSETLEQLNQEFIPQIEEALRKDVEVYLIAMEIHYELKMEM